MVRCNSLLGGAGTPVPCELPAAQSRRSQVSEVAQTLQSETYVALLVGCSRFESLDVTRNLWRCRHHIEAAKECERTAKDDICCSELFPECPAGTRCHRLDCGHSARHITPPHRVRLDILDPKRGDRQKRFKGGTREEEIPIVPAALWCSGRWREPLLGELVSQICTDRGSFGDNCVAIDECGDFAHWIDCPVLGRVLLTGLDVNDDPFVLGVEFLEHPVGSQGPAHRVEVVLHLCIPSVRSRPACRPTD